MAATDEWIECNGSYRRMDSAMEATDDWTEGSGTNGRSYIRMGAGSRGWWLQDFRNGSVK